MHEIPNIAKVRGFIEAEMGIAFRGHARYEFLSSKYEGELDQMKAYLAKYKPKKKYCETAYYLPQHKWGRVMPVDNLSLCIMHRPTRHALCDGIYRDLDMENAHPSIISRICKQHNMPCPSLDAYVEDKSAFRQKIAKHYGVNKDTAKKLPLRLLFGGTIKAWIEESGVTQNAAKHLSAVVKMEQETVAIREIIYQCNQHIKTSVLKHNKNKWHYTQGPNKGKLNENECKRGVMGLWCQTLERFIQESCILWLHENKNFKLEEVVPCQDGFMIPIKWWYDGILADLNKHCSETLGFDIDWADKAFDEADQTIPEGKAPEAEAVPEFGYLYGGDDALAAAIVLHNWPHWKYCERQLYVFDDQSGMWSTDPSVFRRVIQPYHSQLKVYRRVEDENKLTTNNYATNVRLCSNLIEMLKSCPRITDDDWLRDSERKSAGCLLFNNGWLNMRRGAFHGKEDFDPELVFFAKIPRDYDDKGSDEDLEYSADIRQRLFYASFGEEMGDYAILTLARALAGDVMKRALFGLGPSNTGKGVLTNALSYSCGGYVDSFNAEAMAYRANSSNDEAQKLRWAFLLRSKRIVISNEVRNGTVLDGAIFKKLTGGEQCSGRTHCGEETSFLPSFTMLLLANDVPKFNENSDAVDNRIRCVKYEKSFVNKPAEECGPFELPGDPLIKEEICTERFKRCFLQILLDRYLEFCMDEGGKEPAEPECVRLAKEAWFDVVKPGGVAAEFMTAFKLTGGEGDYVTSSAVETWLAEASPGTSMKKLAVDVNRHIAANGLPALSSKLKKLGGKVVRCWMGVRNYKEGEVVDSDESIEIIEEELEVL